MNSIVAEARSLKNEVREGRPKTAVVSENIDAVRELIMPDRHVTYRQIEASLDISCSSIRSILHEQLADLICCPWMPHNLTNAQKKVRGVECCKEMLENCDGGALKDA